MANNNRLTRGEASVGSLIVDDLIRFSDATEQTTAYVPTTVDKHYISAYSTAIQTNTGGGTASIPMSFPIVADANALSIVSNSRITPSRSGNYNIQFSAQVDKTDSNEDDIDIWIAINGTAVPDSNTRIHVVGNNAKAVAAWNWLIPLEFNQYAQIFWYSADTAMRLYAEGPQTNPTRPGIPSIILTAWEI
jgi:hypothetical protein